MARQDAAFDELRPHGWQDAEAAYSKDNSLAREAGSGRVNRAIRALQLETEIRTDPQRRADRFVEDWRKLDQTSRRQYEAGDIMAHKATRRAMGDMAKSLERDPQLESLLANRKRELGIGIEFRPPTRPGTRLQSWHRPWQRSGYRPVEQSGLPPFFRYGSLRRDDC